MQCKLFAIWMAKITVEAVIHSIRGRAESVFSPWDLQGRAGSRFPPGAPDLLITLLAHPHIQPNSPLIKSYITYTLLKP
jgi:hypothetical protein